MNNIYIHFAENIGYYTSIIAAIITILGYFKKFSNEMNKSKKITKYGIVAVFLTVISLILLLFSYKGNLILKDKENKLKHQVELQKYIVENNDISFEFSFKFPFGSNPNEEFKKLKSDIFIYEGIIGDRINGYGIDVDLKLMPTIIQAPSRSHSKYFMYKSTNVKIEKMLKEELYTYNLNGNRIIIFIPNDEMKIIKRSTDLKLCFYRMYYKNIYFQGKLNEGNNAIEFNIPKNAFEKFKSSS